MVLKPPEHRRYIVITVPLHPERGLDEIIGHGIFRFPQTGHIREWTLRIAAITFSFRHCDTPRSVHWTAPFGIVQIDQFINLVSISASSPFAAYESAVST
jgi:hypothetical protein